MNSISKKSNKIILIFAAFSILFWSFLSKYSIDKSLYYTLKIIYYVTAIVFLLWSIKALSIKQKPIVFYLYISLAILILLYALI